MRVPHLEIGTSTHFELGIASWENAGIKQCSKSNLLPAALAEGDDGAENLRCRFEPMADGFDDLASGKPLEVDLPGGKRSVPIEFTFCGDFQIHKALLGMSKYTSAIWCGCEHDTTGMYRFRPQPATTWSEFVAWFAETGCEMKTIDDVCSLNHWSADVLHGRPFKQFKCSQPGCGYEAKTEKQWRADIIEHEGLESKLRKQHDCEHGRLHKRHRKFLRPMLKNMPPLRMSADILHLLFINMFVTLLECTVLVYVVELDETGRAPIEKYLGSKKIPMKIVKAQNVGEMKDSLTGRDAKVLMESAELIIPELLCFVHAPKDAMREAAAEVRDEAEHLDTDDFDWDGGADGGGGNDDSLESKVAAKVAGARVARFAADESKGALLDALVKLTETNMRWCSSAAEIASKRREIKDSIVVAIVAGSTLLAFTSYRAGEKEGTALVHYLFELQRDVKDDRT